MTYAIITHECDADYRSSYQSFKIDQYFAANIIRIAKKTMISVVLVAFVSYLVGSVPFGLLLGKLVKGVDLRDFGSGNIGATNAGRVLGAKWGILCLILDALKGLVPVAFLPGLLVDSSQPLFPHCQVVSGIFTIIGHMFPCWLGFRGGKGVATSLGVLIMLSPWSVLAAAAVFFSVFALSRVVSLSSMCAAIAFGAVELFRLSPFPFSEANWSRAAFAIMVPILILVQHRSNIRRLLLGKEPAFTMKSPTANESSTEIPKTTTNP